MTTLYTDPDGAAYNTANDAILTVHSLGGNANHQAVIMLANENIGNGAEIGSIHFGSTNIKQATIAAYYNSGDNSNLRFYTNNGASYGERMRIANNGNVTGTYGSYHVSSDNGTIQMGLIAQEVEKVVPEVVHTADDEKKTKAVEYEYMVGLLVEAIKEQQAQIEALRAALAAMKR